MINEFIVKKHACERFCLLYRWMPTAGNFTPSALTRPGRDLHFYLGPAAFQQLRLFAGGVAVDILVSLDSAWLSPSTGMGDDQRLPYVVWHHCARSAGADAFLRKETITPGWQTTAFGCDFLPPVMARHDMQYMTNYGAHAVIIIGTC